MDFILEGKLLDTMIAHYLLDPSLRHNMDYMAKSELNYEPIPISELIGDKKSDQKNIKDIPLKKLVNMQLKMLILLINYGIYSKKN